MSEIIDRRINGRGKSAGNQQRFLKRYKNEVREAVARAIAQRKIADTDRGEQITIPARGLKEPSFTLGSGGRQERVLPGNEQFGTGDRLERPRAGLIKTQLARIPQSRLRRGGYRSDGTPANLSMTRTMRESLARRIALGTPHRQQLAQIDEQIARVRHQASASMPVGNPERDTSTEHSVPVPDDSPELAPLMAERARILARMTRVPFIDEFDLRYNNRVPQPQPIAQAVMFCLMDVSGSMDEHRKDLAKRFFILLHLFLTRHYERIELVFIRHHSVAAEVDEEGFFHSRESGGTVVSSALELTLDIMKERYPTELWNSYVAQASDGDNWDSDCPRCHALLLQELLPRVQYYCYVEVDAKHPQALWEHFESARAVSRNLAMGRILNQADVYPVLRELFLRKELKSA
ncbi:MAG: YeaH/YhbH family protein [Burkholderiales bacterium]|nr:YeaH/YhbH family protein [Burkholderiales bacterium]